MKTLSLALSSVLVLSVASPASAGLRWRPMGPWSETVHAIVIDPRSPKTLYAGTDAGVFKSADGAQTWKRSSAGMEKVSVLSLAIDPKTPATLYAGGYRGGLFKSTNGGVSWQGVKSRKDSSMGVSTQVPLEGIGVDPVNPAQIMFGNVYKSATGGSDFVRIDPTIYGASTDVSVFAFHPKTSKTVYAGGSGALIKTTDFGVSWKTLDFGVPSPAHVAAVAIHPKDSETVFVGTKYKGLFRTTDGGANWSPCRLPKGVTHVYAIALDPKDPENLYLSATIESSQDEATVYRSADGGVSFEDVGEDLPYEPISALVMEPGNPEVLYAGTTFGGVYKTTNGGRTWEESSNGFTSSFRTARGLAPGVAGTLYTSTYSGVYRTTNDGVSWTRLPTGIEKGRDYSYLAVGPGERPIVVAGSEDAGLLRSADGGETWQRTAGMEIRCLVADPSSPKDFYVCADDGGIHRGAEGTGWQNVSKEFSSTAVALAIHPKNPQDLWAAVLGGKLWRSVNGGKKWKEWKPYDKIKGGMVRPAEHRRAVALAFDPKDPQTLYAATEEDGVLRTADLGETWALLGFTGEKLTSFAVDPADPSRLAVGTQSKGVYLSTDRGVTWNEANEGLSPKKDIRWVAFGPGTPSKLYVSMKGGGVQVAQ